MAKKKSKAPEKVVDIEVQLPISAIEARKRGEMAGEKLEEADKLEIERKSVSAQFLARIKSLNAQARTLLKEARGEFETKTVKAHERRNFKTKKVEFWFKGKLVKSREMTFADHQEELPLKAKAWRKREVGSDSVGGPSRGVKQPIDDDVAGAIRQQTNAKTAHSSVDGAAGTAIAAQ